MPIYQFQHPSTKKVKEIVQRMNEPHVYVDGKGVEWLRIFAIPTASIDTKIDPFSARDFKDKTSKKNDSVGSLWDRSRELSEQREKVLGKDPVKEKASLEYTKRTGKTHPELRKHEILI